jgi:hypothetical protein
MATPKAPVPDEPVEPVKVAQPAKTARSAKAPAPVTPAAPAKVTTPAKTSAPAKVTPPAKAPAKPAAPPKVSEPATSAKPVKVPKADASAEPAAPTFSESLSAAAKSSGFGQLTPGETPSARALLSAIGGIRGIFESVLPGVGFLAIYLPTHNLLISVLIPVLVVFIFAVARAGAHSSLSSTITGGVLLAISAILVLITGRAVTNYAPGIIINVIGFVAMLASIVARWPLIGLIVGLLFGDVDGWRKDAAKRRILTIATWLWVGLFAIRLALEVPLFYANNIAALGVVRLITSVPLYALFLWATWLLVRGVYAGDRAADDESADDDETP